MSKALFSKTDDEIKMNESFVGFKTDQHEIRVKVFFNVNICTKHNFHPSAFWFYKGSSNLVRRNVCPTQGFSAWHY